MAVTTLFSSKKSVLFTIAAMIMVAAISATATYLSTTYLDQSRVTVSRLVSLQNFVENVGQDLDIAVYTTAFRSLVALQNHISTEDEYIINPHQKITELMINGTLDGINQSVMVNNTITKWQNDMQENAQLVGLDLSLAITQVTVYQQDPWNISVNVSYTLLINDTKGVASYSNSGTRVAHVPILGFLDPISIVQTDNRVVAAINITPYDGAFPSNLTNHILGDYFLNWSGAPSYLMRLAGNFSSSPYGIERLIDKAELAVEFTIDADASSADYVYWSTGESGNTFSVGTPFFTLDNRSSLNMTHQQRYNLSALVIG